MDIGSTIRNIRTEHKLSQEQFAQQFHVTRQTVSNWENNKNYPDLQTLLRISETFDVSMDALLKEDTEYVQRKDSDSKSVAIGKWIVLILIAVLSALIFWIWYGFQPTPIEKRILSDTDLRMLVELPGETPSRALTRTYTAELFNSFSADKQTNIREEICGKLEGDIPGFFIQNSKEECIAKFIFQSVDLQNIQPQIQRIEVHSSPFSMPPNIQAHPDAIVPYQSEEWKLNIFLPDFLKEEKLCGIRTCIFTVYYQYRDIDYVSLTALNFIP